MERMDWIRERLSNGESPDQIIEELEDAGWTESGAEQAVWQAVGGGLGEGVGGRGLRDLLPVALGALALVVSVAAALFVVMGGQGAVATPVQPDGDGSPGTNDTPTGGTDGDTGPNTVTLEISEGVLSAPSQRVTPLPARLRVFNNDDREYTLESSGLGISSTIAAGDQIAYDISSAGTYTVTVRDTGESVTFQVG